MKYLEERINGLTGIAALLEVNEKLAKLKIRRSLRLKNTWMYLGFSVPVTSLQLAYDYKADHTWKKNNEKLATAGQESREKKAGKRFMIEHEPEKPVFLESNFSQTDRVELM